MICEVGTRAAWGVEIGVFESTTFVCRRGVVGIEVMTRMASLMTSKVSSNQLYGMMVTVLNKQMVVKVRMTYLR